MQKHSYQPITKLPSHFENIEYNRNNMTTPIKRIIFVVIAVSVSILFILVQTTHAQEPSKRIEVSLNEQRLRAYENNQLVYDFVVSTGKSSTPTPKGGFWPWIKLDSTTMQGGSRTAGDYYHFTGVPHVMYFYNENYPKWMGYAIHGTYWHNNFGTPMSHGCINLTMQDAQKLYYWTELPTDKNSGTLITIN